MESLGIGDAERAFAGFLSEHPQPTEGVAEGVEPVRTVLGGEQRCRARQHAPRRPDVCHLEGVRRAKVDPGPRNAQLDVSSFEHRPRRGVMSSGSVRAFGADSRDRRGVGLAGRAHPAADELLEVSVFGHWSPPAPTSRLSQLPRVRGTRASEWTCPESSPPFASRRRPRWERPNQRVGVGFADRDGDPRCRQRQPTFSPNPRTSCS